MIASANGHGDTEEKVRDFISKAAGSRQVRERGYFVDRPIEIGFGRMARFWSVWPA